MSQKLRMYPEAKTGKSRHSVLPAKMKGTTTKETTWSCSRTVDSEHSKKIANLAGQPAGVPAQPRRITVSPYVAPIPTIILDLGCFERFSSEVTRSWNTVLHEPVPKRKDYLEDDPKGPAPEDPRGGLKLDNFTHVPPRPVLPPNPMQGR